MSIKILIVNCSAAESLMIKDMLDEYNVLTACGSSEALQQVDQHPGIGMVILDLTVPCTEGFELLGYLKSNTRHGKLRVLIITNAGEPENEIKGLKLGAVDYIRRPVQEESLKARIEMHLELMRQEDSKYNHHRQGLAFEAVFQQAPLGREEVESALRYCTERDRWTGLYNYDYMEHFLRNDIAKPVLGKRALISINLSAVQLLTMTYGLHYTQDLIKKIANLLKHYRTDRNLLFKTYENRFVFYVKNYRNRKEIIEFCKTIARTLEPVLTMERVNGGFGVYELDQNNNGDPDIDQILKKLLIASEKAVNTHDRDFGISFYDARMEAQINRESDIMRELAFIAGDINDKGLFLLYQPVLDLRLNTICGFEALARLKSDKLGLVSPLEFIPIAEKTKLIIPIGQKIFRMAFHFLKELKQIGYGTVRVFINVSVIQLLRDDFIDCLFERIQEMQINPETIGLEITESTFYSDRKKINEIIGELRETGMYIAIDDFGTGYSSLARASELNVDYLKIDKCFTDKLLLADPDRAAISDIVSMVYKLGCRAIAEGVEHEKQKQYLLDYGCDKMQGYLFSKPLDKKAAIESLQKINKHTGI